MRIEYKGSIVIQLPKRVALANGIRHGVHEGNLESIPS